MSYSYLLDTRSSGCTSFRSSGCPQFLRELLDSVMYTDELKVCRFTDRLLDPSELLEAIKLVCSELEESYEDDDWLTAKENEDLRSLRAVLPPFKRYLNRALYKTKRIRSRRILFKVRKLVVRRLPPLIALNEVREGGRFCR